MHPKLHSPPKKENNTCVDTCCSKLVFTTRCVKADRILRDDMSHNAPNAALGALTETAQLGRVDAFLSHSWCSQGSLHKGYILSMYATFY